MVDGHSRMSVICEQRLLRQGTKTGQKNSKDSINGLLDSAHLLGKDSKTATDSNFEQSVPLSLGRGRAEWGTEEGWVGRSSQSSGKRRGLKADSSLPLGSGVRL